MRTLVTIAVLLALLGASAGVAVWTWRELGEVAISPHGLIALGLGAGLTFLLGAGLMALVFVSNRRGYDQDAYRFGRAQPPEEPRPGDRTGSGDRRPPPDRG